MAPSRPITRTLAVRAVVIAGLVLVAGCSDDGETTTAGSGLEMPSETGEAPDTTDGSGGDPTTTEDAEDPATTSPSTTPAVDPTVVAACDGFAGFFPLPVAGEAPESETALIEALEALAADGPEPQRAQAQALLDLQALDEGEGWDVSEEELNAAYEEGLAAAQEIYAWALDTCETDTVVWSCLELSGRERFEVVGEAIDGPGDEPEIVTTTTEPGAATPEDVFSEARSEGEPVEVSRSDDEVVVAWVDDEGHAVEVLYVIEDGGWRSDGLEHCDDGS